ncbi:hypothetical protein [Streptomyces wuyuanensis]|uniref:hypothetical protein n=1 Tax=Streptomyces wuyuanensis TaxID=1196353 RepID=UPI003D740F01
MVDEALRATRAIQSQLRDLPSRVVIYLPGRVPAPGGGIPRRVAQAHRGARRLTAGRAHGERAGPGPADASERSHCGGCSTCCAAPPQPRADQRPTGEGCWWSRSTAPPSPCPTVPRS